MALRRARESLRTGGAAAPRQNRQSRAGPARGARCAIGRRDRRSVVPGRPQRPRRAPHANQGDRLEPCRDRLAVPGGRRGGAADRHRACAARPARARAPARRRDRRPGARKPRPAPRRRRFRVRNWRAGEAGTRGVETAADAYGVVLLTKLGGDPRALTDLLLRIAGTSHGGPKILLDHPDTRDRVAAIEALAPPRPSVPSARQAGEPPRPLLDPAEWAAVKAICAGS